jgi:hypothetical protein
VRIVYSPLDAARRRARPIARSCSSPWLRRRRSSWAAAARWPGAQGLANFFLPRPTSACAAGAGGDPGAPGRRVDAFLAAGHARTIMGTTEHRADRAPLPSADCRHGFEPSTSSRDRQRPSISRGGEARGDPARARRAPRGTVARASWRTYSSAIAPARESGRSRSGGSWMRASWAASTPRARSRTADRDARNRLPSRGRRWAACSGRRSVPEGRLHTGAPARRADGLGRGSLRGVLPPTGSPGRGSNPAPRQTHEPRPRPERLGARLPRRSSRTATPRTARGRRARGSSRRSSGPI